MQSRNQKISLSKKLLIWLGSFVTTAILTFRYFGVPAMPLILCGVATLVVTLARHFLITE